MVLAPFVALALAAPLTDLSVSGFSCTLPDTLGYRPGVAVTVSCTVPVTVTAGVPGFTVARIHLESWDVGFVTGAGGFPTWSLALVDDVVVDGWGVMGTQTFERTVTLNGTDPVSGADVGEWLAQQFAKGRKLRLAVEVDANHTVVESDELNNTSGMGVVTDGFFLTPLTGTLRFGSVKTTLTAGSVLELSKSCCAVGPLVLSSDAEMLWAPGGTFAEKTVAVADLGVRQYSASAPAGMVLAATGSATVTKLAGTFGGLDGRVDVTLSDRSIKADQLTLSLPPGVSYHATNPFGAPVARGDAQVLLGNLRLTNRGLLSTLGGSLSGGFLHAGALPFYLEVTSLSVTSASVTGKHSGPRYVGDVGFLPGDPRAPVAGLPLTTSNELRFARDPLSPQPRPAFALKSTGLAATVTFGAGLGRLHFPRINAAWQAFAVSIDKSALKQSTLPPDLALLFEQSPDCPSCPASTGGTTYATKATGKMGIGTDGGVLAPVAELPEPKWGPTGADGARIFERERATPAAGVLFIPGFSLPGTMERSDTAPPQIALLNAPSTSGRSASESLLGARAATSKSGVPLPAAHYSLPDAESRRGNYFAAGVTVGPEQYAASKTGKPVVGVGQSQAGATTAIRFGGPDAPGGCSGAPCAVEDNLGTRYVVRPAGVTGAFNTSAPPHPTVYGYELPFSRFAFRQVLNAVDPYTWNDGVISVEAPGGFDVAFTSMGLECTGALSEAPVVPCDPSLGPDAPNCGESLLAWKAAMTPRTLGFVPEASDDLVCLPGDRQLSVGAEVSLAALDEPVGVTAIWLPDGAPEDARVTGGSDNGLERPAAPSAPSEDQAFPVALHSTVLFEHQGDDAGWFVFNMDFAAPFFDMVNADVRLENTSTTTAAPTVLRKSNGTGAPNAAIDWESEPPCTADNEGDCAPRARYTWGGTGLNIDLPVWFDPDAAGARRPRFGGVTLEHSIGVASVNAGVEYLTPDSVRVVFGASADFETLGLDDLVLSLDINDALSLENLDALCATLGVPAIGGKGPFEAMLGGLQGEASALLAFTGDAIVARLREAVELAVDAALDAVALSYPRLLDQIVELLLELRAFPAMVASELVVSFDDLLAEALVPFSASLDAEIHELFGLVVSIFGHVELAPCTLSPEIGAECDRALELIDTATEAVTRARNALDALGNVRSTTDAVDGALAAVDGLVANAEATVSTSLALCKTVQLDVFDGGMAQLETPSLTVNPLLALLVVTAVPQVQGVLDQVKALDLVSNINWLASIVPVPAEADEIESDLVARALELISEANMIIPSFKGELQLQDYSTALSGAVGLVDTLELSLHGLETDLGGVTATVEPLLLDMESEVTKLSGLLEGVLAFLAELRGAVVCAKDPACAGTSLTGKAELGILLALDAGLSVATDGELSAFIALNGDSFTTQLPDLIREPVDLALAEISSAIELLLPTLTELPPLQVGEDLRLAIVDLIMGSPALELVTLSFQNHFTLLTEDVSVLVDDVFGQVDELIAKLNASLANAAADALAKANAVIAGVMPDLPIQAAAIDGYAQIAGDALERLHVGADFTMTGSEEEDTRMFTAALDVTSWATNGKGPACAPSDASALLDATISAQNLPLRVGTGEVTIEDLSLGFTLLGDGSGPPSVIGLFGGITTDGALNFADFSIFDIGFEAGAGALETYVGATAGASFSAMAVHVSFLVGRTCNDDVLTHLDPQAAEFITLPGGVFNGAYVRGAASMPIIDLGCLLNLSLTADVGTWLLGGPPLTLGGLVGGGAYGKIGCIGALRGQATAFAELSGDTVKFKGEGWGAAGVGLKCDPETWTTLQKSREDKSCGTGDASLSLTYQNGKWTVPSPHVSAVH